MKINLLQISFQHKFFGFKVCFLLNKKNKTERERERYEDIQKLKWFLPAHQIGRREQAIGSHFALLHQQLHKAYSVSFPRNLLVLYVYHKMLVKLEVLSENPSAITQALLHLVQD